MTKRKRNLTEKIKPCKRSKLSTPGQSGCQNNRNSPFSTLSYTQIFVEAWGMGTHTVPSRSVRVSMCKALNKTGKRAKSLKPSQGAEKLAGNN